VFLCLFWASLSALLCTKSWPVRRVLFVGALIATAATFSFGNGVVCSAIPLLPLWLGDRRKLARAWPEVVAYLLWSACLAGLTIWGILFSWAPPPALTGHSPFVFLLNLLGNPLVFWPTEGFVPMSVGVALLAALVIAGFSSRTKRLDPAVPGWIALALFSLISCIGVAAYRARVYEGTDARNVTFAGVLVLALVPWIWSLVRSTRATDLVAGSAALLLAAALSLANYGKSLDWAVPYHQETLAAKAAFHFLPFDVSPELFRRFVPIEHTSLAIAHSQALDRIGLVKPPLAKSDEIDSARLREGVLCKGQFDFLQRTAPDRVRATGWATDKTGSVPADAALITVTPPGGRARVVSVLEVSTIRPDLSERGLSAAGWDAEIPWKVWPAGSRVESWAYDVNTAAMQPLCGVFPAP
jgi:hypothetical protein